jgi:predicted DNA-binding protein YlxM (UPF0122 family)
MLAKLRERRKKMLKAHFRGITTSKWISAIAEEYGVSEDAIWQDWKRRQSWLKEVFEMADVIDEINMGMAELSNIKEEAWQTYHLAENAQSKAAALKIIACVIRDKIEILQSFGTIYKKPLKIESEIELKKRKEIIELLKQYEPIAEKIVNRGREVSQDASQDKEEAGMGKPVDP